MIRKLILALIILIFAVPSIAATITVDDDGPADFNNIQAAIAAANPNDVVEVKPGIYKGPGNRDIDFLGKAITVRSTNPSDWAIVASTIVDCNGTEAEPHRGFYFHNSEGPNSVLSGLTITRGFITDSYQGGAGILCSDASPKIEGCIFHNNSALLAGGAICYIYFSNPEIDSCTFYNNNVQYVDSGGAIAGRSLPESPPATVRNCIIWGNSSDISIESTPYCWGCYPIPINVFFSLLQSDWQSNPYINGYGNIVADPCFADVDANDFHLKSQAGRWDPNGLVWVTDSVTSPCIDAGDPAYPIGYEPFPNGGIINMGAYGGTAEASKSYFGGPVCQTIVAGDINGDCKVDFVDFALLAIHWLEDNN